MKPFWSFLLYSLTAITSTWVPTSAIARASNEWNQTNPIRVGVYQNKPKVFLDARGNVSGFFPDVLREIAAEEGWSLKFIPCQWERCLAALEVGDLDLMMDVAYSQERDRRFDFNREIVFASWSVVYARRGVRIYSILDLQGKRIAVLRDSIQYDALLERTRAFDVRPQLVEVPDFNSMFRLMREGEVDALAINRFLGIPAEVRTQVVKTHVLIQPSQLHFITAEGKHADLLNAIDKQLAVLKETQDSVYHQASSHWLNGATPYFRWEWRAIAAITIASLLVLAVVAIVTWNYTLRGEIAERRRTEAALRYSEARFRNMVVNVPGAVFRYLLRPDGTDSVIYMSPGCYDLWEVEAKAVEQNAGVLWEVIDPEDLPAMQASVMASAQTLQPWSHQWRITTPSGKRKWLEAAGRPERQADGGIIWDTLILDVSDRVQAEEALRESEERYRLLAENINDLVCLHQPDGRYLYVSPSCKLLLGYDPAELIGQDPYTFFHPDDCDCIRQESHIAALAQKPIPMTYRMRQKSGDYIWLETLTKPILNDAGQVIRLQTTSRDVTERVRSQRQLEHDALHDSLTGLPNRNLLIDRLTLALERVQLQEGYRFAVLFLDLDRFKVVNDSLGHLAGDALLMEIAHRLQQTVRPIDLVSRLGGDEFVLLLEDVEGVEEVIQTVDRIFLVLQRPFTLESEEDIFMGASIGIVLSTERYTQATEIIRDADIAMYCAKANGRGCYEVFDPIMHVRAAERLQVENDLRKAIENQELVLYYQPIVSLQTGSIKGFEALVRWQHPTKGLISPGTFIPIAEETKVIIPLGLWVLKEACQQIKIWEAQYSTAQYSTAQYLTVSVNVSPIQLRDPNFLEQMDWILTETGIAGDRLILEITEGMLIGNIGETLELFEQLQKRSIGISIDDFGTGYSSLSYIHRLPISAVKIDKSFSDRILDSDRNRRIVETILILAHHIGLQTIAEGIETEAQWEMLQRMGCSFGQGYLFDKPLTACAATARIQNNACRTQEVPRDR